jgi:hypothetical protein
VNTATWIRAAAVLAAIQYTAHGLLFITAKPKHGPTEIGVVEAMRSRIPGMPKTYWQLYFGYGLVAILFGVVEIVLLWCAGSLVSEAPHVVRIIMWVFLLANITHAALVWTYFRLAVPVAFDVLVAICLAAALAA